MKKTLVLVSLFVMPIVIYLFFALASHNSLFLPIITKNVSELPDWQTVDGKTILLKDKITILGFLGENPEASKGNLLNLNQKIFNKFKDFKDFQLVMVCLSNTENDIENIKKELKRYGEIDRWTFVFTNPESIEKYFKQLNVEQSLNTKTGTSQVFIIDKEQQLRGRKGKNKKGEEEYKESYDTSSASEMHNELTDDFKIILREYRLALKKNDPNKRKK